MELSANLKTRILAAIKDDRKRYDSDSKHSKFLGISTSVYAEIKKGNIERKLSTDSWLNIARKLGVSLRPEQEWKAVKTTTLAYIHEQLDFCQRFSEARMLCDLPNIGKTFSARLYAKTHENVAYIDCSQVKTKRALVKAISQEFGLDTKGSYDKLYRRLVEALQGTDNPLIILDEAGDLQHEAFLEIKALWNSDEYNCGWYMMGADGLKARVLRCIDCDKVGYAEIFSRFGDKFVRISGETDKEQQDFALTQAMQVAQANAPDGVDYKALARRAGGLRRVRTEVMKERALRSEYGTGN